MKESPIFTKTYDLLRWLLPATIKFPRQHRFVLAQTVQRAAFDFQDALLNAAYQRNHQTQLQRADVSLAKLRVYLRLCHDLDLLSQGQYRHVAQQLDELGRLLGGWRKKEITQDTP